MEEKDLINRYNELYERSLYSGKPVFTDFLDLPGQDTLLSSGFYPEPLLYGGYDGAERVMCRFGEDGEFPFECVKIEPKGMKFAEKLTHRDILGSVLSLGIERRMTGDIIVYENTGYIFCHKSICGLITEVLDRVRHTPVKCSVSELPDDAAPVKLEKNDVTSSERLDCVIAAVFDLSRSESKELIESERVFIRGKVCVSAARTPKPDDIVSVRGYGKFIYKGVTASTSKGRLRIKYLLYC